jgi:F0F1-type ATP synthase assembly protein I
MAQAIAWSSRITTICLEMVIPAVIGYWLDQWLGTGTVFVLIGAGVGLVAGMMHLIRIANAETGPSARGESAENNELDQ